MKLKLIYCVLFILFLFSPIASADDSEFSGEGETVWPVENKKIEMVAETIGIQPGENRWDAECIFVLRNTGQETEVQVGFPDQTGWEPGAELKSGTIRNFRCFVDGREVSVEHKKGIQNPLDPALQYPFAYVWKMHFKKGQKRIVKNTYTFGGLHIAGGDEVLTYVLKTGALWKDKIQEADIIFDLGLHDPGFATSIKPSGYLIEGHKLHWVFKDFEPKDDVEIRLGPLLQEWYKRVDKYGEIDSVEILKDLLDESQWLGERRYAHEQTKEFNKKTEILINQLAKFRDVSEYKEMLEERNKAIRMAGPSSKCQFELKIMMEKDDLSPDDQVRLLKCMDIVEGVENYELTKTLAEFLLKDIQRKLLNPSVISDSLTRETESLKLRSLRSQLKEKIRGYDLQLQRSKEKLHK
jgi:hypothetical protein